MDQDHDTLPLMRARNLSKTRIDGERRVTVWLPELRLEPGDRAALVGPSGSGKSTILALLSLATFPDRSSDGNDALVVDRHDVLAAWNNHDSDLLGKLRAHWIAFLPQRDGLLEFLTIRQNINCAAELAGMNQVENLEEIVVLLNLEGLLDALPSKLSGGQRQRAAAACTLARRPSLILADEPTASLDSDNVKRVMTGICTLADQIGAAVILATHQMQIVTDYGFRTLQCKGSGHATDRHSVFEEAA